VLMTWLNRRGGSSLTLHVMQFTMAQESGAPYFSRGVPYGVFGATVRNPRTPIERFSTIKTCVLAAVNA